MSRENITLVFDGPAVENHEIDVRDLAPALLAVGALVQAANEEINGKRAQIAVKVRATAGGSFEVDLSLIQSLLESAKGLFDFAKENKEGIAAANELVDLLFKGGTTIGGGIAGLFWLILWLRGKKPDKIEQRKGGEVCVIVNGDVLVTNEQVIRLAESIAVREQARKAVATLTHEGIDRLRIIRSDGEDLDVTKSEVGYFDYQDSDEELSDSVREMNLQIIGLSFKEGNKWHVTDGSDTFKAAIEDVKFLNKIASNEVAFAKGDYLVCDVRERQFRNEHGLRKESTIIKVKDHRPASRQLRLI